MVFTTAGESHTLRRVDRTRQRGDPQRSGRLRDSCDSALYLRCPPPATRVKWTNNDEGNNTTLRVRAAHTSFSYTAPSWPPPSRMLGVERTRHVNWYPAYAVCLLGKTARSTYIARGPQERAIDVLSRIARGSRSRRRPCFATPVSPGSSQRTAGCDRGFLFFPVGRFAPDCIVSQGYLYGSAIGAAAWAATSPCLA